MSEATQSSSTPITREDLFPEQAEEPKEELSAEEETAVEDLAEVQDEEEQSGDVSEAGLGKMRLKDFLSAAGVSMEEFYRDVYVDKDGKEVSVSAAWDERDALRQAHDALLRERTELHERLNQAAVATPQTGISPEAQALMSQAQIYQTALTSTDWSQVDPGTAANQKMDLQLAIQQLQQQAQAKQVEYESGQQEQLAKAQAEADRQIRAKIPEWSDTAILETEKRGIADMLSSYGLQPQEIQAIYDPRVWHMLRDAWKAKTSQARISEGAKKIRKVSKTLSAGSRGAPDRKMSPTDVRKAIGKAKTREERQRLRLSLPLDFE